MKHKTESTRFAFVLDNEQTMANIDHLKMVDYEKFKHVNHLGTRIQQAAKDNDPQALQALAEENRNLLPFLKLEIEDAFISALNLRNAEVVHYFLLNGFQINSVAEDAALTVCYSLEYLRGSDAPIELLALVLAFGANPRKASERDSETAMHVAAQYGEVSFLKLLIEYGSDINAVSDQRETPLGVALRCKKGDAVAFLRQKGGAQKWNS